MNAPLSFLHLIPVGTQSNSGGGGGSTPPAGWAKEARLSVPGQSVQVADLRVIIDETAVELKTTANAGAVTSASGDDVRIEDLDGTALPYDRLHYDAATGRFVAALKISSVSSRKDLRLLAGKSGATETDAAGAWSDAVAAWWGSSGDNRQGTAANDLTSTGVTADAVDPWVGVYDGATSRMTHADGSFLNGLGKIEVEAWVKADATGSDMRLVDQGPDDTGNRTHGLMLRHDAVGYRGGAANVWTINLRVFDGAEYWSVRYESAADVQSTGWQHLVFQWESGQLPRLYIDGKLDSPSWVGRVQETTGSTEPDVAATGTTQMPTGAFAIGGLGMAPMWDGQVGYIAVRSAVKGATEVLLEARNRAEARRTYGFSAFVAAPAADAPTVAMPVEATQDPSATVSYDVAAQAVDPDTAVSLSAAGGVSGSVSSAAVNAGKLDVTTGASGGTGTAAFTATGSTSSSSKVYVDVQGGSGGGSSEYPAALRTINVANDAELAAALASAQDGDHIVLADGTYTADQLTAVSGTAANGIVIRAANRLGAVITGTWTIQHSYYWLYWLDFNGGKVSLPSSGDHLTVKRCKARNYGSYQGMWCRVKAPYARFDRCDLSMPKSRGIAFDVSAGGTDATVYRCYFHDWGGAADPNDQTFEPLQVGFGASTTDISANTLIELCLFHNINFDNKERECISLKSSDNTVRQCHLLEARYIMVRHGNRNRIEGCRVEPDAVNAGFGIGVFDADNVVLTSFVESNGKIDLFAGQIDADIWGSGSSSGLHPAAKRCKAISCNANVRVGHQEASNYSVAAADNRIEDQVAGSVTLENQTNTVQSATASDTGAATISLTTADVGIDAP